MGVRKSYEHLTRDEQTRFVQALHRLKQAGVVDDFARMHRDNNDAGIHRESHFLPWHREFIRRFESKLQEYDPRVSLPYWNSVAHQSASDPLWRNDFMGQFDDAWRLNRQLGGVVLPTRRQVEVNQRRGRYAEFWPELEVVMHNSPHRWVGGAMATSSSPLDPVFFLHHAWIDRLWALWQRDHPGAPFEASRVGYGLNDAMAGFSGRTPAHVLNHHALGYTYETDATVTAVKTRSQEGNVTLFVPGPEGKVWSNFWPEPDRPGQWSDWFPIGDNTFPKGATVTAVKTRSQEGSVTLFVSGEDGKVWSNFWPAPNRPGQWNGWFPIGDKAFPDSAPVTAIRTRSAEGNLTLVAPGPEGPDGKVWSNFWPAPDRPGQWNGWFALGIKTFPVSI